MTKETRLLALQNQVLRLQRRLERLDRISYRYSWARIGVLLGGVALAVLALYFVGAWFFGILLSATGLALGVTIYAHRRVDDSIVRHRVWLRHEEAQIARATLDWERIPSAFFHQPRPDHAFEADLGLTGPRSLQHILDTAVSYEGSLRLRDWLAEMVPDRARVLRRQALVRELAPLHLFRDRLVLNASVAIRARKTWRANQLADWFQRRTAESTLRRWLLVSTAFVLLNIGLLVANLLGALPPIWQFTLVIYLGLWWYQARVTGAAWDEAIALQDALQQLQAVFQQLERFSYRDTPHLKALCEPFLDPRHRPSRYLARLTHLVTALSLRQNIVMGIVLNALLPWDAYLAYQLSQTRAAMAGHAPAWMQAWFELEALSSLANLAYLNPDYTFPEILDRGAPHPFVFQARDLGHPLIPDKERVCNGFSVSELGRVAIITGSNMAGKSVFLKTVGVNLALVQAGGPVIAASLQTRLFRLFASMDVNESVTDGISYFYAEVKRLKTLLDALEEEHPLPLFFFIDEIFRGTNNRERLLGSREYVQAVVRKNGTGLIATHDLELAALADQVPQVTNYHFRDQVAGERLAFDHTLRPGPCPTTNALKIMRLEGLPVPPLQDDEADLAAKRDGAKAV